jgi:hypothetical protein
MPNAAYYRRQAATCSRLALTCDEDAVAERFNLMALEFLERAKKIGRGIKSDEQAELPDPHVIADDDPSGGEIDRD